MLIKPTKMGPAHWDFCDSPCLSVFPLGPGAPRPDFNLYVCSSTFVVFIYYLFLTFDLILRPSCEKAHLVAQAGLTF